MADQSQNTAVLKALVESAVKAAMREEMDKMNIALGQLEIELGKINAMLKQLAMDLSNKKKPVNATKAAAGAEGKAVPAIPHNKLIYFRAKYRDNETYRNELLAVPEIAKLLANEPSINDKRDKRTAEANLIWNHWKSTKNAAADAIGVEFEQLKNAAAHPAPKLTPDARETD
jgi:hypothetical protein